MANTPPDKPNLHPPELFMIPGSNAGDLDECLGQLIRDGEASCALLMDKTGAIISRQGKFDTASPEVTAAVTAGAFAALQSLTRAAEADELSIKFHGGKPRRLYIARVTSRLYLTVLYDERSYSGRIRAAARPAIEKIAAILAVPQTPGAAPPSFSFIQDKIGEVFKAGE